MRSTIHPTNLALTQVALNAALCCVGHICMVGGGGVIHIYRPMMSYMKGAAMPVF